MFVPAEMSEVDIFVLEEDGQVVAETVARLGVMHLLDVNTLGRWAQNVGTEWTGRVSTYDTQARRIREVLSLLEIEENLPCCSDRLDPVRDLPVLERQLQNIEARVHTTREEESTLRRQREQLDLTVRSMEMLAPLSIGISELAHFEHLHMVPGTIPSENLARLETSLFRIPYTIVPVHRYDGRVLIFAFCAHEHADILERALQSAFLARLSVPQEFTGTAQDALVQVRKQIVEIDEKLARIETRKKQLVAEVGPQLQLMLARALGDQAIASAMSHFGHRGRVYLMAGWVPKDQVSRLRAAVSEATNDRVTFEENSPYTPGSSQKIPTLLRNGRLLRPMQQLVATYGTPGYREIDPTAVLTATFVVMFGVMFGDLGHGLTLAALGILLACKIIPRLERAAGIGTAIIACGLSSALFGLLFGSVFGREDLIAPIWLRPLDDMLSLLGISVVFGVLVLNLGFVLHLATAARQGQIRRAVFDKNGVVGLLLYWSILGMVISALLGSGTPGWLVGAALLLAMTLLFAEPLTHLLTGRRPIFQGNALEAAVQAFFELFEALISYLSNTLSYVRLGAFAVAHAGLSSVVLLLADMAGQGAGGSLVQIVVLVLGNALVIGFEGLIVAIQTLRLEYYELFGKFFSGDGVPFKPLTLPGTQYQPSSISQ